LVVGLAFRGVTKVFGDVRALDRLDLEVRGGERLVIVGPSGSGKTTALRVAAGLEAVTEGSVLIGDRDVTSVPPSERNVSMVFQSYALFPHLSVRENIGFGLAVRGVGRAETGRRVEEAAAVVGCSTLLGRHPHELSGGERQRVALARALVREPDVFLLDEPLSNLDAQLRVQMRGELVRLHDRLGATMVYVTHDQVEALTLGERVAVLDGGRLRQVGTPDEIHGSPANRFVATFVGSPSMNVLPAVLDPRGLRAGPFLLPVAPAVRERVERRPVEVGIRPQHLTTRRGDGPEGVPVPVQVVEVAGDEAYLHLEAAGAEIVARTEAAGRPARGDVVRVAVQAGRAFVFDAGTGETLGRTG
jgi:multiple sugar transport system ATP-binding protein